MTSVRNPAIPFVMGLPGGRMQVGTIIIVTGEPAPNCNRFAVSLLCGPQPDRASVAFQFSPRFDTGWAIRNAKLNREWGEEEGESLSMFPFCSEQPFTLEIFLSPEAYLVAVDGHHYCEFRHRIQYSEADTLQIIGDVRVTLVEFKHSHIYPQAPPVNRLNVSQPPVPFASLINGPLSLGGEVLVHGRVKPQANRFHINLQQGYQTYPHPNIAFHLNPRFENGERVIVMNSWSAKWGTEQRVTGRANPFAPGRNFVLIIRRQADHYEVLVNGNRMATFKHRMMADIVNAVAIDGDVSIDKVAVL